MSDPFDWPPDEPAPGDDSLSPADDDPTSDPLPGQAYPGLPEADELPEPEQEWTGSGAGDSSSAGWPELGYADQLADDEQPGEIDLGPVADTSPADALSGYGGHGPGLLVGADPDLVVDQREPLWPAAPLTEPLSFPTPEPVDGFPWADPAVLGPPDGMLDEPPGVEHRTPPPQDLAGYAAVDLPEEDDPWSALVASGDPATSALARFWAPRPGS